MTKGKIYISGKMSGLPDFNYPLFNKVASELRARGHEVVNPAELDGGDTTRSRDYYFRRDIPMLCACSAILMLPGWETSVGARLERDVAMECGLTVYYAPGAAQPNENGDVVLGTVSPADDSMQAELATVDPPKPRESIFEEAHRIIYGDRAKAYGHPSVNFGRNAKMWTGWLLSKLKDGAEITDYDVAHMMILVKVARQANAHARDSLVDICGYSGTVMRLLDGSGQEAQPSKPSS